MTNPNPAAENRMSANQQEACPSCSVELWRRSVNMCCELYCPSCGYILDDSTGHDTLLVEPPDQDEDTRKALDVMARDGMVSIAPAPGVQNVEDILKRAKAAVQPIIDRERAAENITSEIMEFRMKGMDQRQTFGWLLERHRELLKIEEHEKASSEVPPAAEHWNCRICRGIPKEPRFEDVRLPYWSCSLVGHRHESKESAALCIAEEAKNFAAHAAASLAENAELKAKIAELEQAENARSEIVGILNVAVEKAERERDQAREALREMHKLGGENKGQCCQAALLRIKVRYCEQDF